MISVKFQRGVELPAHDFWLDPHDAKPFAFVSHAHSDHLGYHQEIIASAGTARLMRARMGGERIEHLLEFGETRPFRGLDITLLPAGHIFGSAQLFAEGDAGSLLYTGDFKLRPGLSAEPTEWRHAETLIMETTYGLPRYVMPPTEEVIAAMVAFCQETLEDGGTPVLLGYSLGKSQEILCALLRAGLTPMLHGAVFKMTEIYRQLRPDFPTGYLPYKAGTTAGKVLVCPPSAQQSPMITRLANRRVAVLTGWSLDPGARFRYQCDAAFPLTDHADYPDLLRYVELVRPRRVLTLHGFAAEFARDLRERGIEAWALSAQNQLEFTLENSRVVPGATLAPAPEAPSTLDPESFRAFAALGGSLAATTGRLKKISLLSTYLRALAAKSLSIAAVFLTGRPFAQNDPRTLQSGWAVIRRALLAVSKVGEARLREISRRHADAGKTATEVLLGRTTPKPFSLQEAEAFFTTIGSARGPLIKSELLAARLASLTADEGGYLVRILTGDLRIGLKEGLVEEAIAEAFTASLEAVRDAHMLVSDLGAVASLARDAALDLATLRVFHPIKCMLASPEPSAEAVWARLATLNAQPSTSSWVEDKYDGIRAQLHLGAGRVEIFTRDLRRVTAQFGDLARAAGAFSRSAILDGEIIAFSADRTLTFFDLQKRLGRKTEPDLFLEASDVPVIFSAFDLLLLDDLPLLREPLHRRRALLETLTLPRELTIAPIRRVATSGEIEAAFQAARERGNEGLIAKDGASLYTPGRRGFAWVKLKKELATLDVVVVGVEMGHGKRSHVLSDYTLPCAMRPPERSCPSAKPIPA